MTEFKDSCPRPPCIEWSNAPRAGAHSGRRRPAQRRQRGGGALASDQSSAVKDEDLRGLVALFHESQGWVSSQHLEPYVDQVFVGHLLASKDELGTQQVSGALQQNVQLRFNPAFTNASQLWSDNAPPRLARPRRRALGQRSVRVSRPRHRPRPSEGQDTDPPRRTPVYRAPPSFPPRPPCSHPTAATAAIETRPSWRSTAVSNVPHPSLFVVVDRRFVSHCHLRLRVLPVLSSRPTTMSSHIPLLQDSIEPDEPPTPTDPTPSGRAGKARAPVVLTPTNRVANTNSNADVEAGRHVRARRSPPADGSQ